jgi:two-component system LytT family sensor kinase
LEGEGASEVSGLADIFLSGQKRGVWMENLEDVLARKRWTRWLFGFLCWLAIVLFYSTRVPLGGRVVPWTTSLETSASIWFVWVLFVPAIIRCDRLIKRHAESLVQRLLLHVPVSLAVTALTVYVTGAVGLFLGGQLSSFRLSFDVLRASWAGLFHSHLLVYWGILGVYIAWDSHERLRDRQIKTTELERALVEARLGALQTQLNPHFLFNALNAISAHIEGTPRTARRMLEQLGDLLRLSLSHAEDQEIPLAEEIEFIDKYISLQQARFGDRLEVTTSIDPEVLDVLVPTFLLEPLVENAIRHGIAPRSEKGRLEISGGKREDRLRLSIRDNGPGLPQGWDADRNGGIGIQNTRERLQHLYGNNHMFAISGTSGSGVLVEIEIPCQHTNSLRQTVV